MGVQSQLEKTKQPNSNDVRRGIVMRLLLISALAIGLPGCTCFVPPQATNETMDANAFACFGQRLIDPVIAPNTTVLQTDPAIRKTQVATISNTKIRGRRSDKRAPVRKPVNIMVTRKLEDASSTRPANKPSSGLPRPNESIPVKMETPESTQPGSGAEPGSLQAKRVVPAPPKPTQTAYTTDHVLQRAMATIAAKVQDPSAQFREVKRAVRKNTLGKAIDTVCGYVKSKNTSDGDAEDRPFLYLVQEDEAYIVDGSRDVIAETAYRTICN